jgi:hypothetical protein
MLHYARQGEELLSQAGRIVKWEPLFSYSHIEPYRHYEEKDLKLR